MSERGRNNVEIQSGEAEMRVEVLPKGMLPFVRGTIGRGRRDEGEASASALGAGKGEKFPLQTRKNFVEWTKKA